MTRKRKLALAVSARSDKRQKMDTLPSDDQKINDRIHDIQCEFDSEMKMRLSMDAMLFKRYTEVYHDNSWVAPTRYQLVRQMQHYAMKRDGLDQKERIVWTATLIEQTMLLGLSQSLREAQERIRQPEKTPILVGYQRPETLAVILKAIQQVRAFTCTGALVILNRLRGMQDRLANAHLQPPRDRADCHEPLEQIVIALAKKTYYAPECLTYAQYAWFHTAFPSDDRSAFFDPAADQVLGYKEPVVWVYDPAILALFDHERRAQEYSTEPMNVQ